MQICKQIIIQEVVQELQSIKKLVKAQKIEIKMLKRQLQEVEIKSNIMEKELSLFKVKEQKLGQQLGKPLSEMKN